MNLCRPIAAVILLFATGVNAEPAVQRWMTDEGAEVLFVRSTALPIVDIRLTFDAGSARDGDHPGLARLASNLLLEGTADLSAGEIARRFERYGARVSTSSAQDMGVVSLRSLARPRVLKPVVDHLAGVLAAPAFDAAVLDRMRSRMEVGLRRERQDPGALGERALLKAMYGDHPYGHAPGGTIESLSAIGPEAVRAFHERYYVAANLTIAIVGDISRERAEARAASLSSALPKGEPAPALPPVTGPETDRVVRVPFDSAQTHVLIGQPAVARGAADWPALYTANHVLGGNGLVSLLSQAMREERGLSYSSYSYLAPAAREGRFEMGTQVRNDALGEALQVMRGLLAEFHAEGPTAEQIEAARRNITGSYPLHYDSNSDLVSLIGMIGFYDLPLDHLSRFREAVARVDAASARNAFRGHIDPRRLITVLVGPKAVVEGVE